MRIIGSRIYLRRLKIEDLNDIIVMESDPEVMLFTSFRRALTPQEIENRLYKTLTRSGEQIKLGVWGVFSLSDDSFVGWSMLEDTNQPFLEIGYMLPRHRWGYGYATEIVVCLKSYAFSQLNQPGLWAITQSKNHASIAVLCKCDFVFSHNLSYDLQVYQCLNAQQII